jgi:hypothetical protein
MRKAFANKYVLAATNPQATIEELLETVFSARSMPRYYKWESWSHDSIINSGPRSSTYIERMEYPFVNHVKYLGVIFDKRITWRLHLEMLEAKAFRTFIRIYSVFKSEHLSASVKLTLHMVLIKSVMT